VSEKDYLDFFAKGLTLIESYNGDGTAMVRTDMEEGPNRRVLPTHQEGFLDVQLAARRVLSARLFAVFTAVYVDQTVEESAIPASHIRCIKVLAGRAFHEAGLCQPRKYFDVRQRFLDEQEEAKRKKEAAKLRLNTRERQRAQERERKEAMRAVKIMLRPRKRIRTREETEAARRWKHYVDVLRIFGLTPRKARKIRSERNAFQG
jgi:hypothetical protein